MSQSAQAIAAPAEEPKSTGFGTFAGVYTPTLLTILGVVMYLRFGWVVGNAGLGGALAIVLLAHVVTVTTSLSVASIATNRTVGAGGAYYMISRSLGGPMGAAIGLPLFLGQALGVTFYIVGFTESLQWVLPWLPSRITSSVTLLALTALSLKSAELAMKAQYVVLVVIVASLVAFFTGGSESLPSDGIAWTNGEGAPFFEVFAVFFPAVTGIMAGVGMSGDLKNPRRAIPLGTLLAVGTGLVVYLAIPVYFATHMSSEQLSTELDSFFTLSSFAPAIYAGVWGATLSSALGTLLVAPRTLQALAFDHVVPQLFAKGHGPMNEPRNGTVFTFLLALVGILLGDLNAIAPVLTMFMLVTYGITNLACGLERWAASPSFRPSFRVPAAVSVLGAVACFYVMSRLNMLAMFVALAVSFGIFVIAERRALGKSYGDARHGIWAALVRAALIRLRHATFHPQNWRPNLLIQGGEPEKREHLLQLGSAIVGERGVATYVQLLRGSVRDLAEDRAERVATMNAQLADPYPNVFFRVDVTSNIYQGMVNVAQSYGMGSFEANTVMLGWPNKSDRHESYCEVLSDLSTLDRSLLLVHFDAARGLGSHRHIHIWWRGIHGNGSLMLLIGFLIQSDRRWRNSEVTVLTIVEEEAGRAAAEAELHQVLEQSRLPAKIRILLRDARPTAEVMREQSQRADLVLIGVGIPETHDDVAGFFQRMDSLLSVLPTTMMVHSARAFDGDRVLFDAPHAPASPESPPELVDPS